MLEEILKKQSINEADLNFIIKNIARVPKADLIRLGLASAEPVVESPKQVDETPEEVEEKPKARKSKKVL